MELLTSIQPFVPLIVVIGAIFSVFLYFKNPQANSDKQEALLSQRIGNIENGIKEFTLQFNAHVASDLTVMGGIQASIATLGNQVTKLSTIIDERIPKK